MVTGREERSLVDRRGLLENKRLSLGAGEDH